MLPYLMNRDAMHSKDSTRRARKSRIMKYALILALVLLGKCLIDREARVRIGGGGFQTLRTDGGEENEMANDCS
jgi:hypothetical protein